MGYKNHNLAFLIFKKKKNIIAICPSARTGKGKSCFSQLLFKIDDYFVVVRVPLTNEYQFYK